MKVLYYGRGEEDKLIPILVNAIAEGKVFDSEDDFLNYCKEKYGDCEISALGYKDKSFSTEEIFEVWTVGREQNELIGKVIRISNEQKFAKHLIKFAESKADRYPDQSTKIIEHVASAFVQTKAAC